jgi:2,4-diaminopentanoate dehydrogenase
VTRRVVQWATGSIGRVCLRHVIDHPELELVGLKVHNPDKVGRDAGDIVRRPPTGVLATNQIEEILALEADVVLHVPINGESPDEHVEDLCRLLCSGKNVITTVGFTYPWAVGPDRAATLQEAALAGGATLFGTGINPGLVAERLAVTATSICTDVEHVLMQEAYDCTPVASPAFIFDLAGFGRSEKEFWHASAGREKFFQSLFGEVIGYLANVLALPVDRVESDHAVAIAAGDLTLPAGTLAAGTVSAVRWQWSAVDAGGRPRATIRMIWRVGPAQPGWADEDGWVVEIDGAPRVRMNLQVLDPVGRPEKSKAIQYAVAGPVVRAIDDVCAAPPGILVPPSFAAFKAS